MIDLNDNRFDTLPTEDELLRMIPSYEIFKFYIGKDLQVGKPIISPLRVDDSRPSFSLYHYEKNPNIVLYTDFGESKSGGNAIHFVSKKFGISTLDAMRKIIKDISISGNPGFISETETRNPVVLRIKSRNWERHDIDYWKMYGVSIEVLNKFCRPIAYYFVDSNCFKAKKFAYAFKEYKDYRITYKIYQPFATDGWKFLTNHPSSVHQGYKLLPPKGDKLIITKSYKDVMCLISSFNQYAIGVQGEYVIMKSQVVDEYKSRFERVYTLFDNDQAGKRLAEIYEKLFQIKPLFIPDKYYPIKDISDYYKTYKTTGLNFNNL
jgi:hypothetical protein